MLPKASFQARDVVYKAFGWTIRYFMILRDNYFGSFTHFSTLTEYLEKRKRGQPLGDPINLSYREGQVMARSSACTALFSGVNLYVSRTRCK